ncbi:MAG: FAD-binding oxidoreductase, partial [Acidobacteria bacterium]|nr:FAD-binding oxidoreductase [Acidobacteriota bacterium]
GELRIQWGGSCEWYPPGKDAGQLERDVRRHQQWGYATRLVTSNEFRRLLPNIIAGPYASGSFCDAEGTLDPVHATRALLEHAKAAGADVQYPCEIKSFDVAGGRVRAVETSKGRVEADVFVLACGNDTPQLAKLAGVNVPLIESPGVLAHTAPQPKLLERIALGPGAHIKQLWDGRIVTGSSFGGTTTRDASREMGQGLIKEASRFLSHLKDVSVDRVTLGWRVLPKDELPIIGFTERCPNLYITAMHSGVTLAPIVGQFAATEILDGVRVDLLSPFRPARFN